MNTACHSPAPSFTTLPPITLGDGSAHRDLNGLPFLPHFSYSRSSCTANQVASRSVEASDPRLSPLSSLATTAQKSQLPLRCLNQKIQRIKVPADLPLKNWNQKLNSINEIKLRTNANHERDGNFFYFKFYFLFCLFFLNDVARTQTTRVKFLVCRAQTVL